MTVQRYLLDTNVLSSVARRRPLAHRALLDHSDRANSHFDINRDGDRVRAAQQSTDQGTVSRAAELSPVVTIQIPHPVENCRQVSEPVQS